MGCSIARKPKAADSITKSMPEQLTYLKLRLRIKARKNQNIPDEKKLRTILEVSSHLEASECIE